MRQEREVQQLDEYSRQLMTIHGFISRFYEMKNYYMTNEEAYEAVERQYSTLTGNRRYKNYGSFKTVFLRMLRKRT